MTERACTRLFFALDPDESTRSALEHWRDAALGGRPELRLPPPEALHVTLAFLGRRAENEVPNIARVGLSAVKGLGAPVLSARRIVGVPQRRPRLLALDLYDPEHAARDVATAVGRALVACPQYEPEERPFWPHVTLARLRRGRPGGKATTEGAPAALAPAPLVFDRVTLYRSHLHPQGARYEPIERRRLAPSSAVQRSDPKNSSARSTTSSGRSSTMK
jgi:RNA 2',3'-cyclic 3'-phosphodiesterase